MKWSQIRQHFPSQWLLIEAIKAHSEAGQRIIEDIAVINAFPDSTTALQDYARLHREFPERELFVFHTDREELDVAERHWLGIRRSL